MATTKKPTSYAQVQRAPTRFVPKKGTTSTTRRPSASTTAGNEYAARGIAEWNKDPYVSPEFKINPATNPRGFQGAQADAARVNWMQNYYGGGIGQGPASTQSIGGGNSGGGGRGGGGGGGGPNPAAIKAQAESLFAYNPDINNSLRGQANAYQPDIAGLGRSTQANMRGFEDERAQRVAAIVQQMGGLAGNVVQSNSAAMQAALRDLGTQGVNAQPYIDQTMQGQNLATQGLANQAGFAGQLNQLGAQGLGNQLQSSALMAQGAQGTLDANRQQLLNQVAMQEQQQRQQLEQAKREFLLKYGVG